MKKGIQVFPFIFLCIMLVSSCTSESNITTTSENDGILDVQEGIDNTVTENEGLSSLQESIDSTEAEKQLPPEPQEGTDDIATEKQLPPEPQEGTDDIATERQLPPDRPEGTDDAATERQGPPDRPEGQMMGAPAEAITACEDKTEGDSCSFTGMRGSVSGTCGTEDDVFACTPSDMK